MSAFSIGLFPRRWCLALLAVCLSAASMPATEPAPFTEPVSFSFKISGVGNGIMTVHDDSGPHAIGHTTNNATTESSALGLARLRPGKKYAVNFQGSGPSEFWLSYIAPANYQLWIEEAGTGLAFPSDLTYEYTGGGEYNGYNYIIELRPILDQSRAGLGDFTGVSIGDAITWSVGLGGLRSGRSAGRISFREKDLTNAPADRARLYYSEQTNDAQISVAKDGLTRLRQIATAQGIVDFIDIDPANPGSGYDIKFYNWHVSPTPPSWDPVLLRWTPSGSAWRNIRVEPFNATSNTLKITVTENGDERVSVLQMGAGSGTMASGNYILILNEGTGAPWARTTTHTSTKSGGVRDEVVEVKGSDNNVVAKTKLTYTEPGDWGEELRTAVAYETATVVAGTTTYEYYTNSANRGNYRRMASVTDPTGNWVAMQYYDDWDKRGQLKYEFHPYENDPATVSFEVGSTSGRVLFFDYDTADWTGRYSQPSVRKELIGGLETGRSDMEIEDVAGASPTRTRTTVTAYAGLSATQTSVVETYRGDAGADFIGEVYCVKAADESQVSYALARGVFDHGARTFAPNPGGHDWRVMAFHGSQNATVGTEVSTYADQTFEPIRLVPEKSILEITYFNNSGLVIRTETRVYTALGTFAPLTHEDRIYMADSGRLYRTETNNGAITERSYHAGRLNLTIDAGGVKVRYEYDGLNRVIRAQKDGFEAPSPYDTQPTVYTHYVYDAANNVTQTVTTKSATRPAIALPSDELDVFATAQYDFAGRQFQTVANAGTTHARTTGALFQPSLRKTTVTLPDGGQKVVETFRDGQVYRVTGDAVVSEVHNYFVDETTHMKARQSVYGGNYAAWTNTYWDWLGRKVEEWKPGWNSGVNVAWMWYYNSEGQLWKHTQPGMAPTLFTYDALGQKVMSGLDMGGTPADTLKLDSSDRITATDYRFFVESSQAIREVTTKTYAVKDSATATTVSKTRDYLSNLGAGVVSLSSSTDIFGNVMTAKTTVDRTANKVTSTTTAPDATNSAVQLAYNGLLVRSTDTSGVEMLYRYDGLGRRFKTIDPRTGDTTADFYANTTDLEWVKDGDNKTQATYTYDEAGRVSSVKNALSKFTYYSYTKRGQKEYEWGPATYPTQYTYDDEGHLTYMRTYRGGSNWDQTSWSSTTPGTPDITRWVYDARTGFLKEKYDAANLDATGEPIAGAKKVSYTYTLGGKIDTRTWARGVATTYGYDENTGELEAVNYPAGTDNLIIKYNRLGQITNVTDATGERSLDHCVCGKVVGETFLDDYYGAASLTRQLEETIVGAKGRTKGVTVTSGSLTHSLNYGYDTETGRFKTLSAPGVGVTYTYDYKDDSNLIGSIEDTGSGWKQTRTYLTHRDLIDVISTKVDTATKASYDYDYDDLGRRKNVVQTGEVFSRYEGGGEVIKWGYNDRSEVTSAVHYHGTDPENPGNPVGQRNLAFDYDNMGNRKASGGSTQDGRQTGYDVNERNQIVGRTTPGFSSLSGFAPAGATVNYSINGGANQATTRQSAYFNAAPAANNSTSAVWQDVGIKSSSGEFSTRGVFVPKAALTEAEQWLYDDDGNLTRDDRWTYTWDAENRLVAMETRAAALAVMPAAAGRRLEFTYDYLNRRVAKVVKDGAGYSHVVSSQRYLYDNWNLLMEFDATGSTPVPLRGYGWGLDWSGSMQGAGGVGGLLMIRDFTTSAIYQPAYDGNGNLTALTDRLDGSLAAAYEYGPFGELLRATGPYAASNPFRFSTKYTDDETGLVYYGFRYYSPALGRFVSRDPIAEQGGLNLYAFVGNNGVNKWDLLGLYYYQWCWTDSQMVCAGWHCWVTADVICTWIYMPDDNPQPPGGGGPNDGGGGGGGGSTGGGTNTPDTPPPEVPNTKLTQKECDDLATKINNNRNTLATMTRTLEGTSIREKIDKALSTTALYTNFGADGGEALYRMGKEFFDENGMRAARKQLASIYKGGLATSLKRMSMFNDAMDAYSLYKDLEDRDAAMFASHSASVALNIVGKIPGAGLPVATGKLIIENQIMRTEEANDQMEDTGKAAYVQEQSRNAMIGLLNIKTWEKEFIDGGCKK